MLSAPTLQIGRAGNPAGFIVKAECSDLEVFRQSFQKVVFKKQFAGRTAAGLVIDIGDLHAFRIINQNTEVGFLRSDLGGGDYRS